MNLLMLSSSRCGNEEYLASAKPMIEKHLGEINQLVFIPYAGVTVNWEDYGRLVQQALPNINITNLASVDDPKTCLQQADAIAVGGGNTFNLLNSLYQYDLTGVIKQRVANGMPYIGWSAGSNICGQSIKTTNDMPIVEPPCFDALNFLPLQLNPHYTDYVAPGHNGETRAQRIAEFCTVQPSTLVLGIPEGTALEYKNQKLTLLGRENGVAFKGDETWTLPAGKDITQYIKP